jgi:phospholipid-binding lipoprotein MlaA
VPRHSRLALVALATLAPQLAAAAPTPGDPFESFNRKSFAFSIRLDHYIVGPFAKLSTGLIPAPLARVIHNLTINLAEPQTILNDVLQARPEQAVKETTRVVVNTTFGLLGAVDLAAGAGIRHEPNGFGDTLGRYGVKPGPYLYIPILGPSDFRDITGAVADQFSSPMVYVDFPYRTPINLTLTAAGGLEQRQEAGAQLDALLNGAADPYATLRSTYLQAREAEIRGQTALPPLPDIEGPGEALPSTGSARPSVTPDEPAPAGSTPDPGAVSPGPAPRDPPSAPPPTAPSDGGPSPSPPPSPATP